MFWGEGEVIGIEDEDMALKKSIILNTRFIPIGATGVTGISSVAKFNYQPRMYPLLLWAEKNPLPETLQKIMNGVEKLRSLNEMPFFDYYWVLVPSLSVQHPIIQKTKDNFSLRIDNETVIYNKAADAEFALDTFLVKKNQIIPIVIGERDGKCYFVSHFA